MEPTATPSKHTEQYAFDDIVLDSGRRSAMRAGRAISLSKLSFKLLRALAQRAPAVVSHTELTEAAWDPRRIVTPETLSQSIVRLRQALGDSAASPRYIESVRGHGYRLIPPVLFSPAHEPVRQTEHARTWTARTSASIPPASAFTSRGPGVGYRLAKLSCPVLPNVVTRDGLLERLEQSRSALGTWIVGAPGAGKTTLAASYAHACGLPLLWYQISSDDADPATFFYYMAEMVRHESASPVSSLPALAPEYLLGLEAYARSFAEGMLRILGDAPRLLVFDNLQEVKEESPLTALLPLLLEALPLTWQVLLISRRMPPPTFARLRANRQMDLIDDGALRFTRDESLQLAALLDPEPIDTTTRETLLERGGGWAAGLVLLLQGQRTTRPDTATVVDCATTPDVLFDYFAAEVYEALPSGYRDFLMRAALLPVMSAVSATVIANEPRAETLLTDLAARGHFTLRHRGEPDRFQFHPLFREFLLQRCRRLAPLRYGALLAAAVPLAEAEGEIDTAVQYLTQTEDWPGLVGLLARNGPQLIGTGRHDALRLWLEPVPEWVDTEYAWLRFWRGMATIVTNPTVATQLLESAFHAFGDDLVGRYTAAAAVCNAYLITLNVAGAVAWLDTVYAFHKATTALPEATLWAEYAASLAALMQFVAPDHPEYPTLEESLWELAANDECALRVRLLSASVLASRHTWGGAGWDVRAIALFEQIHRLVTERDVATEVRTLWLLYALQAWYWYGKLLVTEQDVAEVIAMIDAASAQGLHVFDARRQTAHVQWHIGSGRPEGLHESLGSALNTAFFDPMNRMNVLGNQAWVLASHGSLTEALEAARASAELTRDFDCAWLWLYASFSQGQLCALLGKHRDALRFAARAGQAARQMRGESLVILRRFISALVARNRGQTARCVAFTRAIFEGMARHRYIRFPYMLREPFAELCAIALEHDIEVEHVQHIVLTSKLEPPIDALSRGTDPAGTSCCPERRRSSRDR